MGFPFKSVQEIWNGAVLLGLGAGSAYLLYNLWTTPSPSKANPDVCPISGKSGGKCPLASMGCFQSKDEAAIATQATAPTKKENETKAPETANKVPEAPAASTASAGSVAPTSAGKEKNGSASVPKAPADGKKSDGKPEYSWNKKKPDPKDFMFSKLTGQVCIKEPGSINGQMFIVEDCEDCDIYLCDYMATVQIDYCKNCRIFVGPTESSIFIRNCENCKCIFACQQYRARECKDCDTLLFSSTAPVIEMSSGMRFGCFRFFYFSLAQQFEALKLSVFDNKWSEIYDFNPNPSAPNWSFLPPETTAADLMKPLGSLGSFVTPEEATQHKDDEEIWPRPKFLDR